VIALKADKSQKDSIKKIEETLKKLQNRENANINKVASPEKIYEKKAIALSSNIPIFKGRSDEDVENWLFLVETNMSLLDIPEKQKILSIANFLKNQAFYVYKKLIEEESIEEWEVFKDQFKKQFLKMNYALSIRDKLRNIRQTRSVCDYNDEFTELSSQAWNIADIEALAYYINGLKEPIGQLVRSRGPDCLLDALRDAMSLDSGNYATTNVNYVKQINKPRLNKNNRETRKCFQ
jgi:hypothetical protein